MNIVNISNEKRKIIESLQIDIGELKIRMENRINELSRYEVEINEKQALLNELMGLPLQKKDE